MRVHVEQNQYDFFACLPIIQECLTVDPITTRLHACRTVSSNYTEPCSLFRHCDKPIRILLSIMWFTEQISANELLVEYHEYHSNFDQTLSKRCLGYQDYEKDTNNIIYRDKYLNYRLCYSLHSSFSEIIDLLKTLKPQNVTPIASPLISLLSTKRLFQIINYFLPKNSSTLLPIQTSMITIKNLNEKLEKKSLNYQIQLKHRYESFETKFERKRRRKLFKEQQQRKANDEELDLGYNDYREEEILHKINLLIQSNTKDIRTKYISKNISSSNQIIPIQPTIEDQSVEFSSVADDNECIMSDASSDTVDYDFDTETTVSLAYESQQSIQ